MIGLEQVTGLVLAGGLGRRMAPHADGVESIDKGLETFRGLALVEHVIRRLAPQVRGVIVNANRNLERYRALGVPVFPDEVTGYAGPLAGLHAGLRACPTPWLASAPCDSPFLPPDLVSRLGDGLLRTGARIAVARAAAQLQPVFLLVARELLPDLEVFLASGQRKVAAWCSSLRVAEVDFPDERAFRNFNTREDLERCDQDPT